MKTRHAFEKFGYSPIDDSQIRIERLEKRLEPAVPFPHKHDFFHILLLEKGVGLHEIDFVSHKACARQLFIMKPGQVHSWTFATSTRGFVLEFTNFSFLAESTRVVLANRLLRTSDCKVLKNDDVYDSIHSLFEMLHAESKSKREGFEISLRGLLEAAIVQMIRVAGFSNLASVQTSAQKSAIGSAKLSAEKQPLHFAIEDSVISNFRALLETNFRAQHEVGFYAEKLKLSPKALTMRLKRALGKSPSHLIQERLILEAKRMLSYSALGIAEIGYELGFDDPNYFSRFFKKQSRITPALFRISRARN